MSRSITRGLAAPAALAVLLAGCSTPDESVESSPAAATEVEQGPAEDDEAEAWPEVDDAEEKGYYSQGKYLGMNETGTGFILDVPAEGPDDIEAFREAVGGDEIGYISVEIDNTDGTETESVSGAVLVDTDGQEYVYAPAFFVIGDWQEDAEDLSTDEYNQSVDLYNEYLDDEVRPTAKKTVWLLGPAVPDEMSYLELESPAQVMELQPLA